jgi:hypothetical protein
LRSLLYKTRPTGCSCRWPHSSGEIVTHVQPSSPPAWAERGAKPGPCIATIGPPHHRSRHGATNLAQKLTPRLPARNIAAAGASAACRPGSFASRALRTCLPQSRLAPGEGASGDARDRRRAADRSAQDCGSCWWRGPPSSHNAWRVGEGTGWHVRAFSGPDTQNLGVLALCARLVP